MLEIVNMLTGEQILREHKQRFANEAVCSNVLLLLSSLANKYRLQILCLLKDGEFNVTEIIDAVGGKPSNISQQIKLLALSGYIQGRRQEKHIYYHLADENIRTLLVYLQEKFSMEYSVK